MKTRYYLDTEFIEDGRTIDLLSIALVTPDGREFYAESTDADLSKASPWVRENVIAHLWHYRPGTKQVDACRNFKGTGGFASRREIAREVLNFCNLDTFGKPEFWGYYADYDWVAFCQLFGAMMDLPRGYPMYCRDIKQLCDTLGDPELPKQGKDEHHALSDARWNRSSHEWLITQPVVR